MDPGSWTRLCPCQQCAFSHFSLSPQSVGEHQGGEKLVCSLRLSRSYSSCISWAPGFSETHLSRDVLATCSNRGKIEFLWSSKSHGDCFQGQKESITSLWRVLKQFTWLGRIYPGQTLHQHRWCLVYILPSSSWNAVWSQAWRHCLGVRYCNPSQ